ncbi:hypothetical protein ACFL5J_00265 [Thermodesulfobacteriota bacterium]
MLIYAYSEKKGLLNLSNAIAIQYYGKAERQTGLHEGTLLIASYADGSKYVLHDITLDEINRSIMKGINKTFFIKWEKIGPFSGSSLEFD